MTFRLIALRAQADAVSSSELPSGLVGCITPTMKSHYTVLMDRILSPDPRLDDSASARNVVYKFFFRTNRKLKYTGSGSTDLGKGRIQFWIIRDDITGGGTDVAEVKGEVVTYFKEL